MCFASLSPILCSASLFSSPCPSLKFVHSVFHPKNSAVLFSLGFFFAYAIIGFYSGFAVFLLCSPSFAFPRCIHSDPALQFCMLCLFCFSFTLYSVFPAFFPSQRVFLFSGIFAALLITSRALLAFCLQSSFASQTMVLCRAFLATSSLSFVFIWPCCFQRYFVLPALPHFLAIV